MQKAREKALVPPKPRPPPKPKPPKSAAVSADLGLESATLNVNNLDQLELMLQGEATSGAQQHPVDLPDNYQVIGSSSS